MLSLSSTSVDFMAFPSHVLVLFSTLVRRTELLCRRVEAGAHARPSAKGADAPCFWRPRRLTARPFHMEGAHKPVPDRPLAGLRFLLSRGPTGRRKTMAAPVVTMQHLIEAGAHFGHQTHRWNPRMKPYILDRQSTRLNSS